MDTFLWIGLGGFVGANARYLMTLWVNSILVSRWGAFPFGTIVVNVLGSFGLAIFGVWFGSRVGLSPNVRLLIGTGFFGAFTTFSTYANESMTLFDKGGLAPFLMNVIVTNGLCLVGVILGLFVAQRLFAG
jgi:fluoride exporter